MLDDSKIMLADVRVSGDSLIGERWGSGHGSWNQSQGAAGPKVLLPIGAVSKLEARHISALKTGAAVVLVTGAAVAILVVGWNRSGGIIGPSGL